MIFTWDRWPSRSWRAGTGAEAARAAILLVALLHSVPLEAVEVDPASSVIVVPSGQDAKLSAAAGELREHLKLVTGAELPVVTGSQAPAGTYAFLVGIPFPEDRKPFAPEEARWRVTAEATYLYGDHSRASDGVCFAIYDFLERQLGIRWIEPGLEGTAYAHQPALRLEEGAHASAPELLLRKIRTSWRPGQYPDLTGREYVRDFAGYVRSNAEHDAHAKDVAAWQRRMRMGGHDAPSYSHAFTDWWKKYGGSHPDYFALLENGKREPRLFETLSKPIYTAENPRGFQEVKLCPSNPAVARRIVTNWVDAGKRTKWINVGENDGSHGYCTCEECRNLDVPQDGEKPLAHLTDRYVHLANAVAREARAIDPEAGVVMYAYDRSMLPPRREKLEPNVAVGFVPTTVDLQKIEDLYRGWEEAGAKLLMLRPNYHTYYNPIVIPAGFDEHMFNVFQIAHRHGVRGADYDSLMGNWPVTGLSDYVLARAFSDPSRPFDHWVDQYCSAFGNAAGDVKRYFEYWRNELWNKRLHPSLAKILGSDLSFARRIMFVLGQYYRAEDFDATDAILREAATRELTEAERTKLDRLTLANRHARLTFDAAVAQGQDKNAAALTLLDFREKHKWDMNVNLIGTFSMETRFCGDITGVRRAAALREYDLPWIDTGLTWRFRLDPENAGEREQWGGLSWDQTADWDRLRVDSNWENPYDSETDPRLAAKLKNYDGVGWYATRIRIPQELKGKRVFLHFDTVRESCRVYVNGQLAGERIGRTGDETKPFAIEIGPCLDWDDPVQQFTVRVENKSGKGGMARPAWIVSRAHEVRE